MRDQVSRVSQYSLRVLEGITLPTKLVEALGFLAQREFICARTKDRRNRESIEWPDSCFAR